MIFVSNCLITSTTDRFRSAVQIILMQSHFCNPCLTHQSPPVFHHRFAQWVGWMHVKNGSLLGLNATLSRATSCLEHLCQEVFPCPCCLCFRKHGKSTTAYQKMYAAGVFLLLRDWEPIFHCARHWAELYGLQGNMSTQVRDQMPRSTFSPSCSSDGAKLPTSMGQHAMA